MQFCKNRMLNLPLKEINRKFEYVLIFSYILKKYFIVYLYNLGRLEINLEKKLIIY